MLSKRVEAKDIHNDPHHRHSEDVLRGSEEEYVFPEFNGKGFE
jgi:hypothetical protein